MRFETERNQMRSELLITHQVVPSGGLKLQVPGHLIDFSSIAVVASLIINTENIGMPAFIDNKNFSPSQHKCNNLIL